MSSELSSEPPSSPIGVGALATATKGTESTILDIGSSSLSSSLVGGGGNSFSGSTSVGRNSSSVANRSAKDADSLPSGQRGGAAVKDVDSLASGLRGGAAAKDVDSLASGLRGGAADKDVDSLASGLIFVLGDLLSGTSVFLYFGIFAFFQVY